MSDEKKIKIGIVAGEHSGDALGAELIKALKKNAKLEVCGVGGPKLESLGLQSIFDFSILHMIGLVDPILNYRKLIKARKKIIDTFINKKIDFFIAIDSPDFNIGIHKTLKKNNIAKNIQVVSPSVWGWRQGRIKKIKKYIDYTACLFNFEHEFYKEQKLKSIHLGHPLGNALIETKDQICRKLSMNSNLNYISVLPGSRYSELKYMLPVFIEFIKMHSIKNNGYKYLIPASDEKNEATIKKILSNENIHERIKIIVKSGLSREFFLVSDFSIEASGTASLEAAVFGANPIICYKTNFLNYSIISKMLKVDHIGLPNLLFNKRLFPELLQKNCSAKKILSAANSLSVRDDSLQMSLIRLLKGKGFDKTSREILSL